VVLDASALLTLLHQEVGWQIVDRAVDGSVMSAVNLAEVFSKLEERSYELDRARANIASSGIEIVPFDEQAAFEVGKLRTATRAAGLSLGDRACLALARTRSLPVLTTDRAWTKLDIGVEVRAVR
jgi:PIN domain nuclease of toxin-antitoxin system